MGITTSVRRFSSLLVQLGATTAAKGQFYLYKNIYLKILMGITEHMSEMAFVLFRFVLQNTVGYVHDSVLEPMFL